MDPTDIPAVWGNYASIAGLLFLALLVWLVPTKLIFSEAPDTARWRDIRVWASVRGVVRGPDGPVAGATALIAVQIGLYLLFT